MALPFSLLSSLLRHLVSFSRLGCFLWSSLSQCRWCWWWWWREFSRLLEVPRLQVKYRGVSGRAKACPGTRCMYTSFFIIYLSVLIQTRLPTGCTDIWQDTWSLTRRYVQICRGVCPCGQGGGRSSRLLELARSGHTHKDMYLSPEEVWREHLQIQDRRLFSQTYTERVTRDPRTHP